MKKKLIEKTTIRFLAVGVVNTLVGDGMMFLLYNLLNCSFWFSSAVNYVLGGIVSFFLNKYFTFQNCERSGKQVLKFVLNMVICYLIAYGAARHIVMLLLPDRSAKLQENAAMFIGMGLYTILNYLVQRFFVFQVRE